MLRLFRILLITVSAILLVLPVGQVSAYTSEYHALRINEVDPLNLSGIQETQIIAKNNMLYISSYFEGVVQKISHDGSTNQIIAGKLRQGGYSPDGSIAANSTLEGPTNIAVGDDGTVYIAERNQHRIRAVLPNGILTTIAGNGTYANSALHTDAPDATQTPFSNPSFMRVGPDGNLYVLDSNVIRRILPDGSTDHVAGSFGAYWNSNPYIEGGVALDHSLPEAMQEKSAFDFDNEGNIYYAATADIYKINNSDGRIHNYSMRPFTSADTLDTQNITDVQISPSAGFDIDSQNRAWIAGGNPVIGNTIRYIELSDGTVRTAAGGGNTDISAANTHYSSILGTDLKLPSYIKSLSADDNGKVYYIAPYISQGSFRYYIGALSTTPTLESIRPVITAFQQVQPNERNWHNTDITVTYVCSDAQSGIASCSSPTVLNTDGMNQSATGTAVDNAGNKSTDTISGINIDKTKPTATNPTINGWLVINWGNPVISTDVSDALSGVAGGEYYIDNDPGQGNGTAMTYANGKISAQPIITTGTAGGWHTIYMRSKDAAGNWSTPTSVRFFFF